MFFHIHSVHPSLSAGGGGGEGRGGGAGQDPTLGGEVAEKEGVIFLQGGCSFFIKNKLKSEIFNDKKFYKYFSVIIKNLNWEILTKNSVAFKRF